MYISRSADYYLVVNFADVEMSNSQRYGTCLRLGDNSDLSIKLMRGAMGKNAVARRM